ncbi:15176_t:CDS:1, partial [Funneliformis caledonium]
KDDFDIIVLARIISILSILQKRFRYHRSSKNDSDIIVLARTISISSF